MKRKLQLLLGIIVLTFGILALNNILSKKSISEIEQKRLVHEQFLANSPFKNTDGLTKMERLEQGLPPTKYLERIWELTMNPALGRPTPENLEQIRADLQEVHTAQFANRVPGDASGNDWIERGPDNVGGRSRAVMFDPNDLTNETVFAGGVSGGLWKNTNISNASSVWTQVGLPENLNISCIASDPNDSDIISVAFIVKPITPSNTSITHDNLGLVTISGKAGPNSTITVIFPDGSQQQTTADNNGNYSLVSTAPQNSGSVSISSEDAQGNDSDVISVAFTVTPTTPTGTTVNAGITSLVNVSGTALANTIITVS